MPPPQGTQPDDATLKLDGLRARQTVDKAIGKLWQISHDRRRSSQARRLANFHAYLEDYMRTQPDDDARSTLSPTPSPRSSPPPAYYPARPNHNPRRRRKEDIQRYWSWERQEPVQVRIMQKSQKQQHLKSMQKEDNMHGMVTRSRTSTRTRFYKLRLPP